jgi:hypothetical protein
MVRRSEAIIEFDALSIEGGLLPPEWLGRVAALDAGAQSPADYGVKKGLHLRDEITRYWRIAGALWADFASARGQVSHDADSVTHAFVRQLLADGFGFEDLVAAGERVADSRRFPVAYEAHGGRIPIVVGSAAEKLDDSTARHGDGTRRRSAWAALQEYLNASDDVLWGLATNGYQLRLGRDNASLTRPAWLQADLERIFTEERFADFSVLWLTLHASRFGRADASPDEAPLEAWRAQARERGSRARNQLRTGVEAALLELGQGFVAHPANAGLRAQLAAGGLTPQEYFNELLRLVYRAIFLLTLEEREILHPADASDEARRLYADGYGLRRLRERAVRGAGYDRHTDLWASLRPVFAALGSPAGEPALGLRGLGGLFGLDQCPHLDAAEIENRGLLTALFRLAWIREGQALARVNWRDMGPEELGSVYESLLELVPTVRDEGRRFAFAGVDESAGNARKLTGSYYTPDELVQELLDSALEPVVAARLAGQPNEAEQALLSISVIDPACGSGHFLLAAARRLATHLARGRSGGTPGVEEYQHALRDVVTHCIHGVDRNPMALELARMALWLEAYTPDRALGFLDHHLIRGDALLGLVDLRVLNDGIPDEAFKALTGDDRSLAKNLARVNRSGRKALEKRKKELNYALQLGTRSLAEAFAALDELTDDVLDGVEAKRTRYAVLRAEAAASPAALAADIYLAAFLVPKQLTSGETNLSDATAAARFPATGTLSMALDGTLTSSHSVAQDARRICREAYVLHWPLTFPQVFAKGGFDVVLGNPPWEKMKLKEQEFFSQRAPAVAQAASKAERERAIRVLAEAPESSPERAIYSAFAAAKRQSDAGSVFCHSEARYPLTGVGDVNTYALFAETAYQLLAREGRAGLVLPTGIATDDSTKAFFSEVAQSGRLASLYDFENRGGLFPAIDSRMKFCLFTVGRAAAAEFAFFATGVAQLRDVRRRFRLAPADFQLINPNTQTCPVFRSEHDAELIKSIYSRGFILRSDLPTRDAGWGVWLRRMFHKSGDAEILVPRQSNFEPSTHSEMLPVYEGEYGFQFDHRFGTFTGDVIETTDAWRSNPANLIETEFVLHPREFQRKLASFDESGFNCRTAFLGFRRVSSATNERTAVACILPWTPSTYGWILSLGPDARELAILCGLYNCLVFDWLLRSSLSQPSIPQGVFEQVAVPHRSALSSWDEGFIVPRVLELTYTAYDLKEWARELGYVGEPFRWDPVRRAVIRAELDAYFAHLYRLSRDELCYILNPADVMGQDYPSETFRVLQHKEMREFGEYRTQRLVLDAWDRLFSAGAQSPAIHSETQMPKGPDIVPAGGMTPVGVVEHRGWNREVPELPMTMPAPDPDTDAWFIIWALLHAEGGSLPREDMGRAIALWSQPPLLVRLASPELRARAEAWADRVAARTYAPGSLSDTISALADRQGVRLTIDNTTNRSVVASTAFTPREDEIHLGFHFEARLALAVLAGISTEPFHELGAVVSDEDRSLLEAWG